MTNTEITIDRGDLRAAISKMAAKTGPLIESVAVQMVFMVKEFMLETEKHPAYPFAEALRYALNDLYIPFEKRRAYKLVMGSYFGTHGSHVAAKNKATCRPAKPKRHQGSPEEVLIGKDGQFAFRM